MCDTMCDLCLFSGIPVGEQLGEKKASFELPETRRTSAGLPALESTLQCEKGPPPESSACNLGYTFRLFIYDQRLDVCCFPFLQ